MHTFYLRLLLQEALSSCRLLCRLCQCDGRFYIERGSPLFGRWMMGSVRNATASAIVLLDSSSVTQFWLLGQRRRRRWISSVVHHMIQKAKRPLKHGPVLETQQLVVQRRIRLVA